VDELAALRRRTRCKIVSLDKGSAQTAGGSIECNPNSSNSSTYNKDIKLLVAKSVQIELSVKVHGESLNQGE
jgi:hypothetical protein